MVTWRERPLFPPWTEGSGLLEASSCHPAAQPPADTRQPATHSRDRWMQAQRTAFFTSAAICASSAAVSPVSAKATGHMAPSSRFAAASKPKVA